MRVSRAMLAMMAVTFVAACGDNLHVQADAGPAVDATATDAPPLECDPGLGATACGGHLAAAWTYEAACGSVSPIPPELAAMCTSLTQSNLAYSISGTLTFGSDLTYTRSSTTTVSLTVVVPGDCLSGLDCGTVETFIPQMMAGGSGTCTASGADCSCDVAWTYPNDESGSYAVSDNLLTISSVTDAGVPNTYHFCVQGDSLVMTGSDTNQPVPEQLGYLLTRGLHAHDAGVADARDAGADGGTDASDTDGGTSVMLDIPMRQQWVNGHGYCGEVSIQSVGLYYGVWVSQQVVRDVGGGELSLGINETQALDALHFAYEKWGSASQPQPQFQDFMVWMKTYIAAGVPCIFAAYLTGADDAPDYDHIMPAVGIEYTTLSGYAPNDVLVFNNLFGAQLRRTAESLTGTRASCDQDLAHGGCIPQDVDYGVAVTGILDAQGVTLPIRATVVSNFEPNVSMGAAPVAMQATVTVSGLQPGGSYALLRYDDYTKVPTDGTAAAFLASSYDYRTDFDASGTEWTLVDPQTFMSDGTTYYRCVAR
jgi:hypothetical protein